MRALAVIPVLLFHAGIPGFRGGFLGVDVFFVISGFLITSILLREAEEGHFSILTFYNRRVRRIFPALFVMSAIVTIAAVVLLAPRALTAFGQSVVATTLFFSNLLFWKQAGYFDTSALEKPLLHTWSLAVEEQFYLAWPLLLGTFMRFGRKNMLLPFLCVGIAVSFGLAAVWPGKISTFYLPVTRGWELGVGALLAVRPVRLHAAGSVMGVLAIIGAIVLCDEQTPLYIASGLACVGTAALICTEGAPVNRALSWAPCVGIGLISYSLYLWHWPLLAFAHYKFEGTPPLVVSVSMLLVAGGFAYVSYRYVESPFRRRGDPFRAFRSSAAVMAILLVAGGYITITQGLPQRYRPQVASLERQLGPPESCNGCTFGAGPAKIVLWGDSFAMPAVAAVREFAERERIRALIFTLSACPPLLGAHRDGDKNCPKLQGRVAAELGKVDPKLIIIASRWSISSETTRFGSEPGPRYFLSDANTREKSVSESRRALREGLYRTISTLTRDHPHATILLIGQAPELGRDAERCMILQVQEGACSIVPAEALRRLDFSNKLIADVTTAFPRTKAFYLSKALCRGTVCPTHLGSTFVYRDYAHVTAAAESLLLAPALQQLSGVVNGTGEESRSRGFADRSRPIRLHATNSGPNRVTGAKGAENVERTMSQL